MHDLPPCPESLGPYRDWGLPVWLFDVDRGRVVWANPAALRLWAADGLEELQGRDMGREMSAGVRQRLTNYLSEFRRGRPVFERWTLYPRGVPQQLFCFCSGHALDDGRLAMLVIAASDEGADAETLRILEAVRHLPGLISLFDEQGRLLARNPAAAAVYGERLQLKGHFAEQADHDRLVGRLSEAATAGGEVRADTAGGVRWHALEIHRTLDPVTGRPMLVVDERDVTRRRATEERYRALVEQSLVGIMVVQDGRFSYVNPALLDSLGYRQEELATLAVLEVVEPADRPMVAENLRRRLEGEVRSLRYRTRVRRKDGAVRLFEVHGSRIDLDDRPAVASVVLDVTEQDHVERQLKAERDFKESVLDTIGALVAVLDATGRIVSFNRACEALTGYAAREVTGQSIGMLVPERERAAAGQVLQRLQAGDFPIAHENRWRCRDGSERLIAWSSTALADAGGAVTHIITTGIDVTAQRRAEAARRESERRLDEMAEVIADGIYVLDRDGCITFVNPAAERMLGWPRGALIGKDAHAVFHYMRPGGREYPTHECAANRAIGAGEVYRSVEDYFIRMDGSWLPVSVVAAPIVRDGTVAGSVATFHDISDRLAAQEVLEESERRYRTLFNSGHDAVFVHPLGQGDEPGHFIEVNDIACERLGYSREELLSMSPTAIDGTELAHEMGPTLERLIKEQHVVFERVHVARDGRRIPVEINARVFDYKGQPTVVSVARDITDRKRAETEIYRLAHFDPLTGLPNRTLLADRLQHALAQAKRHRRPLAVLFLDLDDFKQVNDSLGHEAGDELLKEVASRIQGATRSGDTAGRMGGDEFIVVIADAERPVDAERVAAKLIEVVTLPVQVKGQQLVITASVGVARYPEDGDDETTLLKKADLAMYRAKRAGKNSYCVYTAEAAPQAH